MYSLLAASATSIVSPSDGIVVYDFTGRRDAMDELVLNTDFRKWPNATFARVRFYTFGDDPKLVVKTKS